MHLSKQVSLNLNVRGLGQSATIAINDRSKRLQQEGRTIYRLGLGQSPFPVPQPVIQTLKSNAHQKDYLPAKGLLQLRKAVAEFHRRKDGVPVQEQSVLVGPGSKELMFILQLVYYGELLVPTPCWVSYVPQANIIGRRVHLMPTTFEDKWHATPELLHMHCAQEEDIYRPRILVLNYPGNPDGLTYTAEELEELAEVARAYQIIVLSDEIYGQLDHAGSHVSIARYYPEGTIISSGLSKWCGAGGWRLGTFTFPPDLDWLLESMAAVASETYTSVSTPIQYAAVRAFAGGTAIERYLWQSRRILSALGNECTQVLRGAGLRVHRPEGGFYLFLDFGLVADRLRARGLRTSADLCKKLLADTGVAILPGQAFARPEQELTARLAYVDFDGARALAAGETISADQPLPAGFVEQYCYNVITATRLIADWVSG